MILSFAFVGTRSIGHEISECTQRQTTNFQIHALNNLQTARGMKSVHALLTITGRPPSYQFNQFSDHLCQRMPKTNFFHPLKIHAEISNLKIKSLLSQIEL